MSKQEENWWEHDPEGLQEKLELLKKKDRTPEEIAVMMSNVPATPTQKRGLLRNSKAEAGLYYNKFEAVI